MQKIQGGGNSLKFRVKSEEVGVKSEEVRVGGSSSSWRFGRLFSFVLSIALLFGVATLAANAADKYWVAVDGIGYWAESNWSTTAGGSGTTFDDGSTAYIYLPVNNVDLNGQSPTVWTFRPSNSYSPSNLCVLNIYNTSKEDSTLTIKTTGFRVDDFKNMVVTFGGSESVGKVIVYNNKANNDSRCPLDLKHNSHLVFDANSEYTEIDGKLENYIGNVDGTSDSVTVKKGAAMTLGNALYIANPANSTGAFVVDGGTVNVSSMIVVGGYDGSTGTLKVNNGGSLSLTDSIYMGDRAGSTGELEMNGGKLTAAKGLYIGQRSTATVTVNGGSMSIAGADTIIGNEGDGVLTINGGTVEFGSSTVEKWTSLGRSSGSSGALYLNGGQLKLSHVRKQDGTGALVFNGGTLVANKVAGYNAGLINANLPVTVNAGGGTIDNGGFDISIPATLSGSGTITFTGSGTTTLSGEVNYSGATAVTPGTVLAVANATAKSNILKNGLVVAGIPTVGQTIMTYTDVLTDEDISKVSCPLAPSTTFKIGEGGKSIVVDEVGAALVNCWTGALDNDLSKAANWSGGQVPTDNAIIYSAAPVTLTRGDDTFKPSSITFLEGSAKVTIEGDEISNITKIENRSSVRHVFNCAVSGNEIDFSNTAHCCEFRGGITVEKPFFSNSSENDNARAIVGDWTITSDWSPVSYNELGRDDATGSSITVLGELQDPHNIVIHPGSVLTAETMKVTSSTYSAYRNNGRLVIKGLMNIANTSKDFSLARKDGDNATIIAGGIVYNTGKWPYLNAKTLVVGADGIKFDSTHDSRLRFSNSAGISLYPRDATLTLGGANAGKTQVYMINTGTTLAVSTKRFESDESATVTVDGIIANHANGGMAVTGCGTLVFNSVSTFTGGLTVGDTATVKVNEGCTPGSGTITLGAGTKLVLTANSSTYQLSNTLNLPTEGTATLRIDGTRLRSGDDQEIATVASGTGVALDPNSTALAGRKATLRVEEGKLILNIVSDGTVIIVR